MRKIRNIPILEKSDEELKEDHKTLWLYMRATNLFCKRTALTELGLNMSYWPAETCFICVLAHRNFLLGSCEGCPVKNWGNNTTQCDVLGSWFRIILRHIPLFGYKKYFDRNSRINDNNIIIKDDDVKEALNCMYEIANIL